MNRYLIVVLSVAALLLGGCATTKSVPYRSELIRLTENSAATYRVDVLPAGHGSGVIITRDGYILTCAHVADAGLILRVAVRGADGRPIDLMASVVAVDKVHDLALLKVDHRFAAAAVLADAGELHAGDSIYNIGYPFDYGSMVGRGYIMRLHYTTERFPVTIEGDTLADIADGAGTSGSGTYLERNGRLMGLMRAGIKQGRLVVHDLVGIENIRAFLEVHRVAFLTSKGPRTYPPLPVRTRPARPRHAAHPAPHPARPSPAH